VAKDLNTVALTCRLTRDPELRHTPSGVAVASLRVAFSDREKVNGEWTDRSNYIDVTVWGNQGEACAQYLAKGRRIAVDGRLRWREWEAQDGNKRQVVEVVADQVVYLDPRGEGEGGAQQETTSDFVPVTATDDDIPF
jgi:single-strand DNA-binding protein